MGVTILILHHLRKSGGEEGTDIAESNDILAIADQAIYLRRDKKHSNRRLLQAPGLGRYPAQPDLVLEFDRNGIFVGLGEANAVQADERASGILAAATEWMTVKELAEAARASESTIRRYVPELVKQEQMETMGEGGKGDPVMYRVLLSPPPNSRGEADDNNLPYHDDSQSDNGQKPTDGRLIRFAVEQLGLPIVGRTRWK